MESVETLLQYYHHTNKEIPLQFTEKNGDTCHFNILASQSCLQSFPFRRRDYYKICLVDNSLVYQFGERKIQIDGPCIVFANPMIAYAMERKYVCNHRAGYICLFNEEYLTGDIKGALLKLNALYPSDIFPYIRLDLKEYEMFSTYFQSLQEEYQGNFEYRKEIIVNLLRLIIYLGIKTRLNHCPNIQTSENRDRLLSGFVKLLDAQFPLDSPKNVISLKSAVDFADRLNIHVNHLNHSLKLVTGKSTSQLIHERILAEALSLIRYSNWSMTEIGFSLGFEYPQHFSQFVKKMTGKTPTSFKKEVLMNI